MAKLHNIQSAIPWTDQTNPAKFPPYEFVEFPMMLADKKGKNICGDNGEAIIFNDQEEVDDFLEANPEIAERVIKPMDEATRLQAENDTLRKLLEENEHLKTRLEASESKREGESDEHKTHRVRAARRRGKKKVAAGRALRNLE